MITSSAANNSFIEKRSDYMWTVFPKNYNENSEASYMPQDFETYSEAFDYAESLDCEYDIESA